MFIQSSIFECNHVKPIPVIASFSANGSVQPVYVRIDGESYKIHSFNIKGTNIAGIDFECYIMVGDCAKPIYLFYHFNEHAWFQKDKYVEFT